MAAAPVIPVVPTVDAIVVVGWMERDPAVNFLMNECVFDPALTPQRAHEIWDRYRQAVAALPERNLNAPQRIPMNGEEQRAAAIRLTELMLTDQLVNSVNLSFEPLFPGTPRPEFNFQVLS